MRADFFRTSAQNFAGHPLHRPDHRRQPGLAAPSTKRPATAWPLFRQRPKPAHPLAPPDRHRHVLESTSATTSRPRAAIPGEISPFFPDMPAMFAQADLIVICRSGAGAVAELAASGKPSVILIPLPFRHRSAPAQERRSLRTAAGASLVFFSITIGPVGKLLRHRFHARSADPDLALKNMSQLPPVKLCAIPAPRQRAADILEEYPLTLHPNCRNNNTR